ncbi:MAG: RraA family protein, partial [Candidatus Brocadiia bacterium]|nr:RraA family protein [Candidatus Brocadiia bacterium]
EDESALLEAAVFMDANECNTVIKASRGAAGLTTEEILRRMDEAGAAFKKAAAEKFKSKGEW